MKAKNLRFGVRGIASLVVLAAVIVPAMAQSPNFPDFSNAANLVLNGNAAVAPIAPAGVLRLNPATTNQVGSAWFNVKQPVAAGFSTTFTFKFSGASSPPADGIALVIQNSTDATAALAGAGGAIGYSSGVKFPASTSNTITPGISDSLAVEFDSFQNSWDADSSHVGIESCGTLENSAQHPMCDLVAPHSLLPFQLGGPLDTGSHTVTIDYVVPTFNPNCGEICPGPTLQVTLDGNPLFSPAVPVDIGAKLNLTDGTAWIGFTGATGADFENQDLLSWTYTPHAQSITQTISPGVTTTYNFGDYQYAITPDATTNHSTDTLTIDAVLVDPGTLGDGTPVFNPGAFTGASCFVYDGTGGHCIEFHANCSGSTDCLNGLYALETSFNKINGSNPQPSANPGLLVAPNQNCASKTPPFDPVFTRNIFTQYIDDPIVKGSGGPGYSCFVAVQFSTPPAPADLALINVAPSKVKSTGNITYLMALVNLGPNPSKAANVTFRVPAGTTLISAKVAQVACTLSFSGISCTPPPTAAPCNTTAIPGSVVCNVGTLNPFTLKNLNGAAIQAVVQVQNQPSGTKITNTATAGESNSDPNPANNTSVAVTTVQ